MARRSTWLVVGVVAAIALFAALDALRGESGAEPAETPESGAGTGTTTAAAPEPAPPQAAAELDGVLYYTDESCRLRAARLPALEPADAPNWGECSFVLSPDGSRVSGAGSGWDTHSDPRRGRLFQSEGGTIQVATNGGPEGEPVSGEAPAWHPDGTLTYFADGAVRRWPTGDVVLSQPALLDAMLNHPNVPEALRFEHARVLESAWLDDNRLAAIVSATVRSGEEETLVAVFDGAELDALVFAEEELSDLRVSPRGDLIAARAPSGLLLVDEGGNPVAAPQIGGFRAIAWAPDGLQAAVATASGVYVFRPGALQSRPSRLPIAASDLAWRGQAEAPPVDDADEAREWLGGLGATGRLFVIEPGCRLRALRMPDLEWEAEPGGVEAPCRFTLDASEAPLAEEISVAPGGELRASCRDGRLAVFGAQGRVADIPEACAPAWMADGTLTFVRNGELWRGLRDPRRVLTRETLRRMFGRDAALEEVAWLDDQRIWAAVRTGPERVTIAAMTLERLVYSPTFTATRIDALVVSASGMVAARTDRGVVFFDHGGRRALSFLGAKAVAWAPGTLVAAVAGPRDVLFVAPISREVVALPLTVADLEWVVP